MQVFKCASKIILKATVNQVHQLRVSRTVTSKKKIHSIFWTWSVTQRKTPLLCLSALTGKWQVQLLCLSTTEPWQEMGKSKWTETDQWETILHSEREAGGDATPAVLSAY